VASKNVPASSTRFVRVVFALAFGFVSALATAAAAAGAVVNGTFAYRDGKPAANRQLHFENRVTGDMFIAATSSDGSFSADLPPGIYDLRAERGVILKSHIIVGSSNENVGRAVEPAPLDYHRPFQHEGIGEAMVESAAPGTANVLGRPVEGMKYGHKTVQSLWTSAKPLPPLGPPGGPGPYAEPTPAAAPSPAAGAKK
jgi:hypothetical protein